MNEENRWKWIAIGCGGILLLMMICCVSAWVGGMVGYSIGKQAAPMFDTPGEMPSYEITPPTPNIPIPSIEPEIEIPFLESGLPWLGVVFFMTDEGAQITEIVDDSPAEAARLRVGDIVTAVDGQQVTESNPLQMIILNYEIGDKITLTILRNGEEEKVHVVLGERPLEPILPAWPEEDPFRTLPNDG
ncbi:MAG: PDZ domain-containing protein [Anaerolineae bacterium]|nr:PDZ domain-containing protein [Anaerolineae bacterium]